MTDTTGPDSTGINHTSTDTAGGTRPTAPELSGDRGPPGVAGTVRDPARSAQGRAAQWVAATSAAGSRPVRRARESRHEPAGDMLGTSPVQATAGASDARAGLVALVLLLAAYTRPPRPLTPGGASTPAPPATRLLDEPGLRVGRPQAAGRRTGRLFAEDAGE